MVALRQADLFGSSAASARPGPAGARRAARRAIAPDLSRQLALVLRTLRRFGARGATDQELADMSGLDGNSLRPRRIDLVARGFAADSGRKRLTLAGRTATVWIATPKRTS